MVIIFQCLCYEGDSKVPWTVCCVYRFDTGLYAAVDMLRLLTWTYYAGTYLLQYVKILDLRASDKVNM
jgi:hypothetical protein